MIMQMDSADLLENREWTMVWNTYKKREHFYSCCPGVPFPDLLMVFKLERRSSSHKAAVVVPGLGKLLSIHK